jgi:hypothetical protein
VTSPGTAPRIGPVGKLRNPVAVWVLSYVTFGVYFLYWWYAVNKEVRDFDARIQVKPGLAALANVVPVCNLVTIVTTGTRIRQAQVTGGAATRCSGWLGLVLTLVFALHLPYYQSQLNDVWVRHQPQG